MQKKSIKPLVITSVFILLLYIALFGSAFSYLKQKKINVGDSNRILINWEEKYPFERQPANESKVIQKYEKVCEWIQNKGSFIEKYFPYKIEISEIYAKLLKTLKNDIIKDKQSTVINCSDNYLIYLDKPFFDTTHHLLNFNEWCTSNDIEFEFIIAPHKIIPIQNQIPGVIYDTNREYKTKLVNYLQNNSIRYYDLEDVFPHDMELLNKFYKSDHHWKIETGLEVSRILAEHLNDVYNVGFDIDKLSQEKYLCTNYGEIFLGSQGKKVTLGYTSPDKFVLLTPSFKNNLHIEIPTLGIDNDGDFELFLDRKQLVNSPYQSNAYATYCYGDQAIIKTINYDESSKKKVLLIHDSFSDSVIPFMSLSIGQFDALDPRHFTGSIRSYIKANDYDIVIFMTQYFGSEDKIDQRHNILWNLE